VPGKRLPMRKISEVLCLRAEGRSFREIAASVGAGSSTVGESLRRAEAVGPAGPVPEWREVHRELEVRKGVTRRLLWLGWREAHPDGWGYIEFCGATSSGWAPRTW